MGLEYKRIMKNGTGTGRYFTNEAGKETANADVESKVNTVRTKSCPKEFTESQYKLQGICKVWSNEIAEHGAEVGR